MPTYPAWRHVAAGLALLTGSACAAELVYLPVNPNFGGYPANGPGLLASAAQQGRRGLGGRLGDRRLGLGVVDREVVVAHGSTTVERGRAGRGRITGTAPRAGWPPAAAPSR